MQEVEHTAQDGQQQQGQDDDHNDDATALSCTHTNSCEKGFCTQPTARLEPLGDWCQTQDDSGSTETMGPHCNGTMSLMGLCL